MIDFHLHFCDRNQYDTFVSICETTGLEKAALISLPDTRRDSGTFNEEVLFAIRKNPAKLIGFGALSHRKNRRGTGPEIPYNKQVQQLSEDGFTGVKIWLGKPLTKTLFGVGVRDSAVQEAFAAAQELGMPIVYHAADPPDMWDLGKVYGTGDFDSFEKCIEDAVFCAETYPDIPFFFAHLLFLAGELDELENILVSHPNVFLDTAPGRWFFHELDRRHEKSVDFFTRFSKRIVFGTDAFFFPQSFYQPQSGPGEQENITTIERISKFLETNGLVDNPYQATRDRFPELHGLGLDKESLNNIMQGNAEKFFFPKEKLL
ncbi:MAG: amidohydrolase family protein [Bacteroidetes bacterium]|nr:amidohydrolase family protein [Bacteroidota bacterium]